MLYMTSPDVGPQTHQAQQVRAAVATMTGSLLGLEEALNSSPVARGLHRSEVLPQPITDSFGRFTKKWTYTEGCDVGHELNGTVGEVVIAVDESDGSKKLVSIGRTPKAWLPSSGGKQIADAGEPGEYLLVSQSHKDPNNPTSTFRYLDEKDINGVEIRNGADNPQLNASKRRNIQHQITGRVTKVVGFLEK